MMKIDLKNMDTYKFVVCVFVFILVFCLIFTMQMKSVINMQNKLLEKYIGDKPKITTSSTYTPSTYQSTPSTTTNKYNQNY